MRKLLCILVVFTAIMGCKETTDKNQDSAYQELIFDYQKMPKKAGLNAEAAETVEKWPEFRAFDGSFDVLYRAKNNEDLILAIDDLIDKENLLVKSQYPKEFDELQIKSRQRVVRTYLLKVKSHILNNSETTKPTIEMITAYNALRTQLNVIVNSQLDKKLILDEQ